LQQVAAEGGHVAQLRRRRPPQRLRQRRALGPDDRVVGDVGHPGAGAEDQLGRTGGVDAPQFGEPVDVHDRRWYLDFELHQVVERDATGEELRPRSGREERVDGLRDRRRAGVREGPQRVVINERLLEWMQRAVPGQRRLRSSSPPARRPEQPA
jgi:hypothetical protein